jgi:hypothetical protein
LAVLANHLSANNMQTQRITSYRILKVSTYTPQALGHQITSLEQVGGSCPYKLDTLDEANAWIDDNGEELARVGGELTILPVERITVTGM